VIGDVAAACADVTALVVVVVADVIVGALWRHADGGVTLWHGWRLRRQHADRVWVDAYCAQRREQRAGGADAVTQYGRRTLAVADSKITKKSF